MSCRGRWCTRPYVRWVSNKLNKTAALIYTKPLKSKDKESGEFNKIVRLQWKDHSFQYHVLHNRESTDFLIRVLFSILFPDFRWSEFFNDVFCLSSFSSCGKCSSALESSFWSLMVIVWCTFCLLSRPEMTSGLVMLITLSSSDDVMCLFPYNCNH